MDPQLFSLVWSKELG